MLMIVTSPYTINLVSRHIMLLYLSRTDSEDEVGTVSATYQVDPLRSGLWRHMQGIIGGAGIMLN